MYNYNDTMPDIFRLIAKNPGCALKEKRKQSAEELTKIFEDDGARARLANIALQSLVDEEYTAFAENFYEDAERIHQERTKARSFAMLPIGMFERDKDIIDEYLDGIVDDEGVCTNLAQGIRFADFLMYMNTHFISFDLENYMRRVILIEFMSVVERMLIDVGRKYKDIDSVLTRDIFSEEVLGYLDRIRFSFENRDGEPLKIDELSLGSYKRRSVEMLSDEELLRKVREAGPFGKKKKILRDWAKDARQERINEFFGELEHIAGGEKFHSIEERLDTLRRMRNKVHYGAIAETIRESGEFSFEAVREAHSLLKDISCLLKEYVSRTPEQQPAEPAED